MVFYSVIQEDHNFDLSNIVTPLNVEVYQQLLKESNYQKDKAEFLVDGFSNGFDLGYRGPRDIKIESKNMKCRVGSKTHLWNMVIAEVKEKRYAGPFAICPFDNFIQSPLGKKCTSIHGL